MGVPGYFGVCCPDIRVCVCLLSSGELCVDHTKFEAYGSSYLVFR